eukprot:5806661-Pleurochrysis_carterae.AAC.1
MVWTPRPRSWWAFAGSRQAHLPRMRRSSRLRLAAPELWCSPLRTSQRGPRRVACSSQRCRRGRRQSCPTRAACTRLRR